MVSIETKFSYDKKLLLIISFISQTTLNRICDNQDLSLQKAPQFTKNP